MKRKNYLIDSTKSQKNIELCLELEMDEGVEEILESPNKCRSMLLDVSIVKPKELEKFGNLNTTTTLNGDEVKKLIVSMAKQKREKQKYLDNLIKESLKYDDTIIRVSKHSNNSNFDKIFANGFTDNRKNNGSNQEQNSAKSVNRDRLSELVNITESVHPLFSKIKKSLKNVESEITNMQNINLVLNPTKTRRKSSEKFRLYKQQIAEDIMKNNYLTTQEIYNTANSFQKFQPFNQTTNKTQNRACVCKNCGVLGYLDENQNNTEIPKNVSNLNNFKINHSITDKQNIKPLFSNINDNFYQNFYLRNINEKLKNLEERIALQEEKSVPRDYFKRIVTKIVSYVSPKLFNVRTDDKKVISEAASLLNKYKESIAKATEKTKWPKEEINLNSEIRNICAQQMNQTIRNICKTPESSKYGHKSPPPSSEKSWKWGEESLKPGMDLKTKIISLLEEHLNRIPTKSHSAYKHYEHKCTTCFHNQEHYRNAEFTLNISKEKEVNSEIPQQLKGSGDDKIIPTCKCKACSCQKTESCCKNVNVAYVNPKIDVWRKFSHSGANDDSANSGRSENKSAEKKVSTSKLNDLGKQEFINILSKTKDSDKELLWKNIWTQAKASGQSKNDTITIKIPNQEPNGTVLETEMVIKEIEELLTKRISNKNTKKKNE